MIIRPDIELANASDVGCVRTVNEDYYAFIEPQDDGEFEKRGRLILVADGMGGYEGGRLASRIAGDSIRDVFLNSLDIDPVRVLAEGFGLAHARIQTRASESNVERMGTTCTCVILRGSHLTLGHIGDSRLYLVRHAAATRVSRDHTIVSDLLRNGDITPAQAETHEKRHVLSAALGVGLEVRADFVTDPIDLLPGDVLLLCSDGLHSLITDEEMVSAIVGQSIEDACTELVAWAKVRGGQDNITLQLVRYLSDGQNTEKTSLSQ